MEWLRDILGLGEFIAGKSLVLNEVLLENSRLANIDFALLELSPEEWFTYGAEDEEMYQIAPASSASSTTKQRGSIDVARRLRGEYILAALQRVLLSDYGIISRPEALLSGLPIDSLQHTDPTLIASIFRTAMQTGGLRVDVSAVAELFPLRIFLHTELGDHSRILWGDNELRRSLVGVLLAQLAKEEKLTSFLDVLAEEQQRGLAEFLAGEASPQLPPQPWRMYKKGRPGTWCLVEAAFGMHITEQSPAAFWGVSAGTDLPAVAELCSRGWTELRRLFPALGRVEGKAVMGGPLPPPDGLWRHEDLPLDYESYADWLWLLGTLTQLLDRVYCTSLAFTVIADFIDAQQITHAGFDAAARRIAALRSTLLLEGSPSAAPRALLRGVKFLEKVGMDKVYDQCIEQRHQAQEGVASSGMLEPPSTSSSGSSGLDGHQDPVERVQSSVLPPKWRDIVSSFRHVLLCGRAGTLGETKADRHAFLSDQATKPQLGHKPVEAVLIEVERDFEVAFDALPSATSSGRLVQPGASSGDESRVSGGSQEATTKRQKMDEGE
ncbi:unnamed protein product [Amoebophrya sp. A120]|nr:unnamed protein product [Amoebophrya sp. A120]|eukprot:GSA120T00024404001.1